MSNVSRKIHSRPTPPGPYNFTEEKSAKIPCNKEWSPELRHRGRRYVSDKLDAVRIFDLV